MSTSVTAAALMSELTEERDAQQSRLDDLDIQIRKLTDQRTVVKGNLVETNALIGALERHEEQETTRARKDSI